MSRVTSFTAGGAAVTAGAAGAAGASVLGAGVALGAQLAKAVPAAARALTRKKSRRLIGLLTILSSKKIHEKGLGTIFLRSNFYPDHLLV
jgi:hypothetical protein